MYHRVDCALCGGVTLQQVDGLVVKSGLCEIECVFDVDVGCAAHQSLHFLQYVVVVREKILLEAASHVEAVYLERFRYQVEGFFLTSQVAQDGSFQLACLVVVPVAHERAVYQVESFLEVAPAAVDGSQVVIGGILPSGIPSRFEESVVRLVRLPPASGSSSPGCSVALRRRGSGYARFASRWPYGNMVRPWRIALCA